MATDYLLVCHSLCQVLLLKGEGKSLIKWSGHWASIATCEYKGQSLTPPLNQLHSGMYF